MDNHAVAVFLLCVFHGLSLGVCAKETSKTAETRWFVVHFFTNVAIAALTIPNAIVLFTDVHRILYDETGPLVSKTPICLALWLHIYHVLLYKMTADDLFHHMVFIPTIGIPGYVYDWGAVGNLQLFFICGVPGALIYAIIIIQRTTNWRFDEPRISATVNIFLRAPGIFVSVFMLTVAVAVNRAINAPWWAVIAQVTLSPLNAVFYAYQSWERLGRKKNIN